MDMTATDETSERGPLLTQLSDEDRFWLGILAALVAAVTFAVALAFTTIAAISPGPVLPAGLPIWADALTLVTALGLLFVGVGLAVLALTPPVFRVLVWFLGRVGVDFLTDVRYFVQRAR